MENAYEAFVNKFTLMDSVINYSFITVAILLFLILLLLLMIYNKVKLLSAKQESNVIQIGDYKSVSGSQPAIQTQAAPITKLYDVNDQDAAMIMAIVSDYSKIPLNELHFKSIKHSYDVDDETAALLMAIVSDQTEIPLDQLYFKTIKEVE